MAEKRTKWDFYYEVSAPKAIDPAKTSKIDALPADSSYSRTIGQEDWNREDALEVAMELGTGGRKIER